MIAMHHGFRLALTCRGVRVDVALNGAPVVRALSRPSNLLRQLAPFVMAGPNRLSFDVRSEGVRGGEARLRVLEHTGSSWTTIAETEQRFAPGDPRWQGALAFVAPPASPATHAIARCHELTPTDQDEITTVLQAVHDAVARGDASSVLPLFGRWIEHHAQRGGTTRDAARSTLLGNLELLGDPELCLQPLGAPTLALVCDGGLCLATDASGQALLRAAADDGEVRMPLVFAKVDGNWTIIA